MATRITRSRKHKNELLVHGYMRENNSKLPTDIIDLCFEIYHIESFLFLCGNRLEINEDKDILIHTGSGYDSCYGSIIMPSTSKMDVEYEYVIKVLINFHEISVGIDDSICKHINGDFSGQKNTKNYAYYSPNGTQYSWKTGYYAGQGISYGESFSDEDTIRMLYNPHRSTLQFWKNDTDQGVIKNIYGDKNLNYRLCIYMGMLKGTSIKLIQ
eukprot:347211_1